MVREKFSEYGPIKCISMPLKMGNELKIKGPCFVEYLDRSGVDKAMHEMNNMIFNGKRIKVESINIKRKTTNVIIIFFSFIE